MKKVDLSKVNLYTDYHKREFTGQYKDGCRHYFYINERLGKWLIIPSGSSFWNSTDQDLWYNAYGVDPDNLPDWLPDIPTLEELQAVPSVNWRDMQKEADSFDANNYPHLKKFFIDNNLSEQKLYFALTEDYYESKYGDGAYRYLKLASFDKQEILDFVSSCKGVEEYDLGNGRKGTEYSHLGFLKEHTIIFQEDKYYMPDFEPETFEHYKFIQLLDKIDERLKG